jgi:hypothetical protein
MSEIVKRLLARVMGFFIGVVAIPARLLVRFRPWHRLRPVFAVAILRDFRDDLRKYNLHDTSKIGKPPAEPLPWHESYRYARTPDGTFNDLREPRMGSAGSRFGRNMPLEHVWPEQPPQLLTPSPREVSRKLMTRDVFKPATTLNVLAAAWIQFQNHEWFNHQRFENQHIEIPLVPGDDWFENPMRIERSKPDPDGAPDQPPVFLSTETHWWDGSQIYGSSHGAEALVRANQDGKLKVEKRGQDYRLPEDPSKPGLDLTGFNQSYWVGMSLLHTLFVLEHNAICDELRRVYPTWGDQRLFVTARLVNSALMAKIHTVEWTPAILGHPALQVGMRANWWGIMEEHFTTLFGRISPDEALSGIPGSPVDHHTAPYYLTEEFVSVYRLHPLIPDDYDLYSVATGRPLADALRRVTFTQIQGKFTRNAVDAIGMRDLAYSFGLANPGAVVLHNFPHSLQTFDRGDGMTLDLAAVDIMRDRERGVPRYNLFRQLLRMPRIGSFAELTENPQWARELEEVYGGDIDRVDLMAGLYAEKPPEGFGFSDTAFRIFILMASRRLKSDRFFTTDYRPEVYTPAGLAWINQNGMKSVLQRHFPELTPAFQSVPNVFAPWQPVTPS